MKETLAHRRESQGHLADDDAALPDAREQFFVRRGIHAIHASRDDADGVGVSGERPAVRRGVDAEGSPGRDAHPVRADAQRDLRRDPLPVVRRGARPDECDGTFCGAGEIPLPDDEECVRRLG